MSYPLPYPFCPRLHEALDLAGRLLIWLLLVLLTLTVLGGCTATGHLPDPAPQAVKVLVPVTQACKVEKVTPSTLPSAGGVPEDIFEAVKRVLGDRAVLLADREALVAANTDPCPESPK